MPNENQRTMDDVPDGVKTIKKFFGYGCAIAAFMLPIGLAWMIVRRPTSSS